MTTYGCVVTRRDGSSEWKSGTSAELGEWLHGQDFTEAVIQPIPSATLDMLRRATQPEHSWMAPSELGRYVCVTHPADGCLHSPDTTIRHNGVWVKTGQEWSSAHADCLAATESA
jgi:hypothetical protein